MNHNSIQYIAYERFLRDKGRVYWVGKKAYFEYTMFGKVTSYELGLPSHPLSFVWFMWRYCI
jgi:hypothetical protein